MKTSFWKLSDGHNLLFLSLLEYFWIKNMKRLILLHSDGEICSQTAALLNRLREIGFSLNELTKLEASGV